MIESIFLQKYPSLAPMAGVTDRSYRFLCREMGASLLYSEMVSAKGVCYQNTKTSDLCTIDEFERPMGIQLFGCESEFMAEAAKKLLKFKPNFYDINMGCPVPKVVKQGSGSALMLDLNKASKVIEAVKGAVEIPVSVKFRTGFDKQHLNAVEFAKMCEASGADSITVHGRTREQYYHGKADWDTIAKVKRAVSIPVTANGDITNVESYKKIKEITGCDSYMIGRASYGNPWIFAKIKAYIDGTEYIEPTLEQRMQTMLRHIKMIIENSPKREELSICEARKYAAWYVQGLKGAAYFRNLCYHLSSYNEAEQMAEEILERNKN